MDWRGAKVSERLDVRGDSIIEIMCWYYEGSLIVNRRYQRKLVWTLEEKRLFIDSILNQYPTPSIILSEYDEEPVTFGNHNIVGITKEAAAHFTDVDNYERKFSSLIKKEPITESLKTYILSNLRTVDFHGKNLLLVPSAKQDEVCYYDRKYYVREGSKTVSVEERI